MQTGIQLEDIRTMQTYAIRRQNAFADQADLKQKAARSGEVLEKDLPDHVRWLRSYVVKEPDGRLGSICIYEATDVFAIRDHAHRAAIAADEILPVLDTIVIRQDPA
ncbi:MAG TPA: nickel-binding protein [Sphingomicrobium sp.]|jgi:hypothetical protein|nr:nickel-binding protein [Sphingomicrobium sp.]